MDIRAEQSRIERSGYHPIQSNQLNNFLCRNWENNNDNGRNSATTTAIAIAIAIAITNQPFNNKWPTRGAQCVLHLLDRLCWATTRILKYSSARVLGPGWGCHNVANNKILVNKTILTLNLNSPMLCGPNTRHHLPAFPVICWKKKIKGRQRLWPNTGESCIYKDYA